MLFIKTLAFVVGQSRNSERVSARAREREREREREVSPEDRCKCILCQDSPYPRGTLRTYYDTSLAEHFSGSTAGQFSRRRQRPTAAAARIGALADQPTNRSLVPRSLFPSHASDVRTPAVSSAATSMMPGIFAFTTGNVSVIGEIGLIVD